MAFGSSIREYVRFPNLSTDPSSWLSKSEIPSSQEIFGEGDTEVDESDIEVPVNKIYEAWGSISEYLSSHYGLLREDALSPLRNVISEVRNEPNILEKDSQEESAIYDKVHIVGFTLATAGIAAKITFSLRRVGKKIPWEQSQRLLSGSIVALTPANDMFKNVCRVAIVAARPLSGVQQNPPEVDIYFARSNEIEIDPQQEWVMVECRNGYFEAYRHTLRALQMMADESFPLSRYIVDLEQDIGPPKYVVQNPCKDLSELYPADLDNASLFNTDILEAWPQKTTPLLDSSQFDALQRILTQEVAIIQGPPGTGKTYVSVMALRILHHNMLPRDPPIIVAAHTNHAIDQLLRHIAEFEPNFIRLGGRTTDMDVIKPRTLYEVKKEDRQSNPSAPRLPPLHKQRQIVQELVKLLEPLCDANHPYSSDLFRKYGVITEAQLESLRKGAQEWVRVDQVDQVQGDIAMWLGRDIVSADHRTLPEDFGNEYEEADLELEQVKELEAEGKVDEDDAAEILRGHHVNLQESFTGRKTRGVNQHTAEEALKKQDLWDIDETHRGPVYRLMQLRLKEEIRKVFRKLAAKHDEQVLESKINRWKVDATYLSKARIIGMTTTGLSKYRGLLQSLKPKIVLIEEAAETLEAYVTAACFDSLQHLILVGDHQQLQGHCTVRELEGEPYHLVVSMFERLVRNQLGYSQMIQQRRMIPEIRRALKPIYEQLEDHESVMGRPSIPGMGGVNTFFFSHEWPESTDSLMSKINTEEATMIVCFFDYLVYNGMDVSSITVLTFYNGQRKLLLKLLRNHPNLQGCHFKVVTVDSYQGEENEIVILSLVRNNPTCNIGFLSIENRVCVAISRARRGFYLFGNAEMLSHANGLWWDIIQVMSNDPSRVGYHLPITCKNHEKTVEVDGPEQFFSLAGGCDTPCREKLRCGHSCTLTCHPFPHDKVNCKSPCSAVLSCGHSCTEPCYLPCACSCNDFDRHGRSQHRTSPVDPDSNETRPFRDFARGGVREADRQLEARLAAETEKLKLEQADDEMARALFGDDNETEAETKAETANKPPDNDMQENSAKPKKDERKGGQRGVWKEVYASTEVKGGEKDKKQQTTAREPSLLD